jgi:hypothetical protein
MISVNISKAKEIAHYYRREARSKEFEPLDLKATIPSEAVAAEQARQLVREKYAVMQDEINNANSPDEIKSILGL